MFYQLARIHGNALIPEPIYHEVPEGESNPLIAAARERSASGLEQWVVLAVEVVIYRMPEKKKES
jgi:hypothetical protein